jgi:hypothetical protein
MKDIKATIVGDNVFLSMEDFNRLLKEVGAEIKMNVNQKGKVVRKDKKKNVK